MRSRTTKIGLGAVAGLVLGAAWAGAAEPNRAWTADFKAALAQAKAENRFVVAFFYSPSSAACEKLQKETFELSAVQEAMEDFVKARLNGEADRGLALLYKVQQFPTVVFLDSQGRELDRFSGFADPSALLRWAAEAIDPKTNYVLLKERLAANPADVEALYYMGFKYTRRSAYDHARKYFDRVEKLDKDNKFGFLDNILLRRAEESLQAGYFDAALKLLDGFGQKYPDSDELDRAELLQARLLWLVGRTDEAMKAYRRFLVAFPQSDLRNQAEASVQALSPAPQSAPEPTPLPGPILPGT